MREKLIELLKDGGVRDFPFVAALADHIISSGFIEKLQNEAYDLGVDSALHNHFGLSWEDAAGLHKEVTRLQNATKWIPVTERLPENICPVLVALEGLNKAFHGWYQDEKWWSVGAGSRPFTQKVTHWMPLPEMPKDNT